MSKYGIPDEREAQILHDRLVSQGSLSSEDHGQLVRYHCAATVKICDKERDTLAAELNRRQ